MALPKFTIHKYVKFGKACWRYKRAALYSNGQIKPNVVVVAQDAQGKEVEETHEEGAYYLYHDGQSIPVGKDAREAHRQRNVRLDYEEFRRLQGTAPVRSRTGGLFMLSISASNDALSVVVL